MIETQNLLSKIAALRERLEQAHGLMRDAEGAATKLNSRGDSKAVLRRKVEAGQRQQSLLATALQELPNIARAAGDTASIPIQLTAQASRLLHRTHELLGQLRDLDDSAAALQFGDPLSRLYRETVSMTEGVLRTLQSFPAAPSAQSRLSEGLEAVLGVVAERISLIAVTRETRQCESARRQALAEILSTLSAGGEVGIAKLQSIAESIHEESAEGAGMRLPAAISGDVAQLVAAHSLIVAQVMARLVRSDSAWRGKPLEPIMAALVHDVGMLAVPQQVLAHGGPLDDDQRRQIERHPLVGADMAGRIRPTTDYLVDAASQHHERIDGTGYPGGLRDLQIKPLVRLLAVCDAYAAMCQPRAHRPALDTRTAVTDTLLMAEHGGLDRTCAERLLVLSFYPPGTVVEISDGSLGVVAATHQGRRELNLLARPVVALLTTAQGELLPNPRHVDLAEVEGRSILRSLPADERRERLGRKYPELVGE